MQSRGSPRGGRSTSAGSDMGYCDLHGKRRGRHDLLPWNQQPGKMRCNPQRECQTMRDRRGDRPERQSFARGVMRGTPMRGRGFVGRGVGPRDSRGGLGSIRDRDRLREQRGLERRDRGSGETVLCRLHRIRRGVDQMREVGRGVWECVESSRCRPTGERMTRGMDRGRRLVRDARHPTAPSMRGGWDRQRGMRRLERGGGPSLGEPRYDEAGASAWAPSAGGAAGGIAGRAALRRRPGRVERKVFCALHGKQLPANLCEQLQDCCHVCRDSSTCLSTPLEVDTTRLLVRNCAEVLCSRHHTLRHVGFVELDEKKVSYQCVAGHACRGVTVPHMGKEAGSAAAGKGAGAAAAADLDDDGGVYMTTGPTNTFLPQSSREAVSSFFM